MGELRVKQAVEATKVAETVQAYVTTTDQGGQVQIVTPDGNTKTISLEKYNAEYTAK